ncbi:hypothetical protein [Craterilacuibacter sp. RT1T]|uniref:hypothetical protein n=1 Tax=Craterilacuibacter sp. RT1T TaxID=2942211 RepID=UPI0020BF0F7F|nr:hypothetical protein [Craterilacuibacter sp. RT1T]MCL6263155.1 hypothetical protein [Craterilacuibacter sp. RT1T]
MKRSQLPRAEFDHDPDELIRVVLFCPHPDKAIKMLGVTKSQFEAWQRGIEAVPRSAFAFLVLWGQKTAPSGWGLFSGLRLDDDGDYLRHHAFRHRIRFDDLASLPEYWRLQALAQAQAETIEQIIIERNFYREQCQREAKFGLMLNRIFRA